MDIHEIKLGFLDSSVGKESACNKGDPGKFPELGRSSGEGIGYPLQYSGLENSMDYSVVFIKIKLHKAGGGKKQ